MSGALTRMKSLYFSQPDGENVMNLTRISASLILSASLLAACAGQAISPVSPARVTDGILTGSNGMTLYVFDKDAAGSGKSVCNGPCATNWPPLLAMDGETASSDYGVVVRDDGRKQWAYKGKPLYYWIKDQRPGDKTGDGVNNLWRIAKP